MRRVAFDPWITRGEDTDYLLNLRMYGADVWFDNKWFDNRWFDNRWRLDLGRQHR